MKPTPIELEMPMGKDIYGVEHREPWKAYDIDEVDSILAEKDKEIAELKAKIIKSKELADGIRLDIEKVKADAAETLALLEERNKQVGELKSDIADLRDDKKLTDAILDERNAEIAELKKERDWLAKDRAQAYDDLEKRAQLNIKQEESIRHHKYKRCLAMARWCASRSASWCLDPADEQLHKSDFYDKWKKRWLELAEKFKESK